MAETDEELENFESPKKSTSILGSLEKMVESSFQDMRCNSGRKRNQGTGTGTGNGILQRLGIDDDQHHSVMMATKKTSSHMFDFYRQCQTPGWREKDEMKRHLKMAEDSKMDKVNVDMKPNLMTPSSRRGF